MASKTHMPMAFPNTRSDETNAATSNIWEELAGKIQLPSVAFETFEAKVSVSHSRIAELLPGYLTFTQHAGTPSPNETGSITS